MPRLFGVATLLSLLAAAATGQDRFEPLPEPALRTGVIAMTAAAVARRQR